MKIRESGMPVAELWSTFFDVPVILDQLGVDSSVGDLVDFGCGYGHFCVAAAQRISGHVTAIDLDPAMLTAAEKRAHDHKLYNIAFIHRDFIDSGSGLAADSQDYVMIFNLLHLENPEQLLLEAYRILAPSGRLGIIHWNYDQDTPRGPPMGIRPKPDQCVSWTVKTGFVDTSGVIDLPPYHYGVVVQKPSLEEGTKRGTKTDRN
ncbi:MAG: class I SAM-dependent methyltransferase [Pseudomonadota bacterium]